MKKYLSPFIILANGTITMTVSQMGQLGITIDVAAWDDFWDAAEGQVLDEYKNFNINDPSTWPEWFDQNNQDTWWKLIGFEP